MSVMLLTESHLEFLSLIGGCTGSSESTLVKMPHCWNHMSRLTYTCTHKSGFATSLEHFGEVGPQSLYNLHHEHILLK